MKVSIHAKGIDLLKEENIETIVVANKIDKVKKSVEHKVVEKIKEMIR